MSGSRLGRWEPLTVAAVYEMLADVPFRWWVSGGRALELYLGRTWRDHDDTDIGILRCDVDAFAAVLAGWELHIAARGRLAPWHGEAMEAARHQNNLWCRRRAGGPWELDVVVGDGDDHAWVFRRDLTVRIPWGDAVLRTAQGVPYLAPDLQLLFKSKNPRDKDTVDAREAAPALDPQRKQRLARLLPDDHPWQQLFAA